MVARVNLFTLVECLVLDNRKIIAKVMLSCPCDSLSILGEVPTGNSTYDNRLYTHCLCFLDEVANIFLVCIKRSGTAIVNAADSVQCSLTAKVLFEFRTVNAVILLIIMRKLNQQEVARMHFIFSAFEKALP